MFGTALSLKPLLELQEGRVEAVENIRTKTKAIKRLLEVAEERLAGQSMVRIAGLHADAEQEARSLLEEAEKKCNPVETIWSEITPVLGTHAGPGTVGLAYCTGL